jgi:ParB family chromosome partitioning protein
LIPRGGAALVEIQIDWISPNAAQPRQYFDEAALQELAGSIREHGILQPIIVTRAEGNRYTLIAGERRWRAARIAGLTTIPAVVKEASAEATLAMALVENVQRADLSPLEEATAYRELVEGHSLTHEQVAGRVGRSRVSITNRIRLLSLPPRARQLLAEGALSEGHARALLGCADASMIEALAGRVVERGLSVRETEELVRRLGEPQAERAGGARQAPNALEEELQRALGTKVQIARARRGGRLVIHYYDEDQLAGIVETLLGSGGSGL